MEQLHDLYVIEHSAIRDEYHLERFDVVLRRNLHSLSYGQTQEWMIVAAARDRESGVRIMESLISQTRADNETLPG